MILFYSNVYNLIMCPNALLLIEKIVLSQILIIYLFFFFLWIKKYKKKIFRIGKYLNTLQDLIYLYLLNCFNISMIQYW